MNIDMRIAFRRTRHGIGDLAIALRAIELIRLKYPCSILMVQSGYPSLLKDHPAINYSYNLSESLPDYDILIDFDISPDNTIPKHALFCNKASETLLQNGYDGIVWDSRPQTLWVHPKERARVWSMIKNISETPIPRARVENLEMGSRVPVGIFWRSAYKHRTWGRFPELIRMLASNPQIQVFCFDSEIPIKLENVYNVIGRELNEVLAWVSNMSYVITNDSAGLHLAGGLDIPTMAIFGSTDPKILAAPYTHTRYVMAQCKLAPCWHKVCPIKNSCLNSIMPEQVLMAIKAHFNEAPIIKKSDLWGLPDTEPHQDQLRILIARFKGIGDVGMLIFGLESLRAKYPNAHIDLLTSYESAALWCGLAGIVDRVIPMRFNHHALPRPVNLPIQTNEYHIIYNLINSVDFGDIAHIRPRADNFAALMDVHIDKNAPVRQLVITDEESKAALGRIKRKSWIIGFQTDSNGRARKWQHWERLARMINRKIPDASIVLLGNTRIESYPDTVNLTGQTTVREYISQISVCDILVCCDSSGLHIGGRLNTHVICLIGSTGKADNGEYAHSNYYTNVTHIVSDKKCSPCWDWQHNSCNNRIHSPVCMWGIKPRRVLNEIQKIIEQEKALWE